MQRKPLPGFNSSKVLRHRGRRADCPDVCRANNRYLSRTTDLCYCENAVKCVVGSIDIGDINGDCEFAEKDLGIFLLIYNLMALKKSGFDCDTNGNCYSSVEKVWAAEPHTQSNLDFDKSGGPLSLTGDFLLAGLVETGYLLWMVGVTSTTAPTDPCNHVS